jgi:hypothetical protein
MAVSRGEVDRAMIRKYIKVVAPIFTKHESFRLKLRNGNGERVIHEVISPFNVRMGMACWDEKLGSFVARIQTSVTSALQNSVY